MVALGKEEKLALDRAIAMGNYLKKNGYKDFDIGRLVMVATIQQMYTESKSAVGLVSGLLGMLRGMGDLQPPGPVEDGPKTGD